jgi:hypothetical protein
MSVLIVREDPALRRIERAISELEARPPAEQLRKRSLLAALYLERAEIVASRSR